MIRQSSTDLHIRGESSIEIAAGEFDLQIVVYVPSALAQETRRAVELAEKLADYTRRYEALFVK